MTQNSGTVEVENEQKEVGSGINTEGGDVKGWNYKGPIDDQGYWSPRGGYEMIVHSHISEDDDERESWVAPTEEERDEFRHLMETSDGLDIASAEFASRVAESIARVQRKKAGS